MAARVSRKLHETLSSAIQDIAGKGQLQLCSRYRRPARPLAESRGHACDCPRDGPVYLGDRPHRSAGPCSLINSDGKGQEVDDNKFDGAHRR
jgi:hypothetical protein